jgi:leucyl/phenylalanyl-tRNA--protein transferase
MAVFELPDDALIFPDPRHADPDGLLAYGGDLSPERLILAYENGIFPWFNEEDPILWWSPDPRCILFPEKIVVSKSMRQIINKGEFSCTQDACFEKVIRNCQSIPRKDQPGTWLTEDMISAYIHLHQLGFAHSVEVWKEETLVGGLYGIALGKCFFGESMFSKVSNASKMALIYLAKESKVLGRLLIDCQVHTSHLESLGAELISRTQFLDILKKNKTFYV